MYPANFEEKIDFDQIRDAVTQACLSEMGRQYVSSMRFSSNAVVIKKMLEQSMEFVQLLETGKTFPTQHFIDCRSELSRLKTQGSYIEQQALFDLKSSLSTLELIIAFFHASEDKQYPRLKALTAELRFPGEILRAATAIIDEKGNIRDNASSQLMEIRQMIVSKQRQVMREVRKAFNTAKQSGWLPDQAEITIRNGRAVIPVKASDKRALQGFIHDESATGQTVFIEPMASAEVNNEIVELENKERREIIKILSNFTELLRPYLEELLAAYRYLGIIDFIRAKALFSIKIHANQPFIRHEKVYRLKKAFHPLLFLSHSHAGKEIVPLDLELDENNRILIISGPNAGGKSVCLKTAGMLQYMLQCGMPIPASPDSEFRIFEHLFIDIGDEQSLENDLSTYSSHLLNMKYFLRHSNTKSLVLIDEFGTGTEPQLGGAIAEATLEHLVQKGTFGVITTHYTNLKLAAERMSGLINGAMLFDVKELKPLYQLKIGKPGSSFAFEIARKIGFPNEVLNRARKKTGGKHLRFDSQLQQLEADKLSATKKEKEIRESEDRLLTMTTQYRQLKEDLEKQKKQIIREAREEALEIINNSNRDIEKTIREIREAQANKEVTKHIRKQLETNKLQLEQELKPIPKRQKPKTEKKEVPKPKTTEPELVEDLLPGDILPGDMVQLKDSDIIGKLLAVEGENSFVNVNDVRLKIATSKILKTNNKPKQVLRKTNYSGIMQDINKKAAQFKLSIDLRGKRAEEAMEELTKYIDDALLLSTKNVSILHGKGYGILREIIREYLGSVKEIERYGDAPIEMGGAGITMVTFK